MRVLHVLSYISKNGGIQNLVSNYIEFLDKTDMQIDFLTFLPNDEKMVEELKRHGHNVYQIKGSEEKDLFLFIKEIKRFFKEHHDYDILHNHQTNLDLFYMREAKKWKIPVRIMHVHTPRM